MPTPETVYCVVASHTRSNHLAKTERVREPDGAATQHRHNGLTMCGAKIEKVYPFLSANWFYKKRETNACPDCIAKWLDDRRRLCRKLLVEAELP